MLVPWHCLAVLHKGDVSRYHVALPQQLETKYIYIFILYIIYGYVCIFIYYRCIILFRTHSLTNINLRLHVIGILSYTSIDPSYLDAIVSCLICLYRLYDISFTLQHRCLGIFDSLFQDGFQEDRQREICFHLENNRVLDALSKAIMCIYIYNQDPDPSKNIGSDRVRLRNPVYNIYIFNMYNCNEWQEWHTPATVSTYVYVHISNYPLKELHVNFTYMITCFTEVIWILFKIWV